MNRILEPDTLNLKREELSIERAALNTAGIEPFKLFKPSKQNKP